MKKIAFVITTLLSAMPALAAEQSAAVPNDAVWIYGFQAPSYPRGSDAVDSLMSAISARESEIDAQFKCQSIYYDWSYSQYSDGIFAKVQAYCQERGYDQKVIMSLERRCEQSPTAECLEDKIKSAIQTIQPTQRFDIGKQSVSEALPVHYGNILPTVDLDAIKNRR